MKRSTARQKNTARRRRLKDLLTTKKATSPGIVALLLIIVTLVAGFFFYNMVTGCIEIMVYNVQEQMEVLFLRSVSMNCTHITSFIGNKAISAISIMSAFINGEIGELLRSVEIERGSVEPVYVLGAFDKGLAYSVKLATNFGGSLTFDVSYT